MKDDGPEEGQQGAKRAPPALKPFVEQPSRNAAPRDCDSPADKHRSIRKRRRRRRKTSATTGIQGARSLPPALNDKLVKAEAALGRVRATADSERSKPGDGASSSAWRARKAERVAEPEPRIDVDRAPNAPTEAGEAARNTAAPVYAALDLGTNNCRLLVAMPTRPGQFRVIDAFSRIVRLGEGLGRTGSLASTAMDRALAALEVCSQKLSVREVTGARLIATEACRAAANGQEFLERVHRETGLDLTIVSRETEARLAVSGCGSLVDRSAKGAVLFDIGGGSTEVALLDLRAGYSPRLANHIVAWTSLPVGVVSLAEKFGGRDVSPELFETMIVHVEEQLSRFAGRHKLAEIVGKPGFHLLGTSGTVTTLAGVHLGLERYDRRQVDGLWLTEPDVEALVGKIAGWSFEERIANPCIGSERADLVLAGCAILQAIRRVWPARALRVADRGLREGLLTEMMVADGVWRRSSGGRTRTNA
ncbi:Ppx/GppA phosphatase family protein [Aureimonas mangrovi]|uniref:Ppx/GppA phosphatase family protein n=1 Tax=Aureimonas mangrovi TaxID=2758041 RepID=UPI00163DC5DA|nr:Ppx/GppA phosphatase family protein [Aureimonas mangrovi]